MKKGLTILMALFSLHTIAEDKNAYFASLSSSSRELANFSFMIDQHLELKCGKPPSLEAVKTAAETLYIISKSLKEFNYTQAREILKTIPCEK